MNRVQSLRRALAFLESKGLDELPDVSIEFQYRSINLSVYRNKMDEEQFRLVKRVFGPLQIEDQYGGKGLSGKVKLDDDLTMTITVYKVYECKEVDPKDLTEKRWDEIRGKIREGLIKVSDCKLIEGEEDDGL